MSNRYKFRAYVTLDIHDDEGEDVTLNGMVYGFSIHRDGTITCDIEELKEVFGEKAIEQAEYLELFYPEPDEQWAWFETGFKLMQYTGVLDSNDKEICEDDIVQITNPHMNEAFTGIVFFQDGAYQISRVSSDDVMLLYTWHKRSETYHTAIDVIGNIHENPELLESKYE